MNDEKRNDVSNKLMDAAAKCISKDDVACVLNDALHGEKKLSGINENCSTCCSVSLAELADLIEPGPERTCRAVLPPYEPGVEEIPVCSVCGRQLLLEDDDEYCPRCGAKLTEDEVDE